jgi:hypothetical protein
VLPKNYKFDEVKVDPNRERAEPLKGLGIAVGTIREVVLGAPETFDIACEMCGHIEPRTQWQKEHSFKCYECGFITKTLNNARRVHVEETK